MNDKPHGTGWRQIVVALIVIFGLYMGVYETFGYWRMGLFFGEPPPRFFIGHWPIPSKIADPFFAPADWIDGAARQVWHALRG
jgi:hypothetical protein